MPAAPRHRELAGKDRDVVLVAQGLEHPDVAAPRWAVRRDDMIEQGDLHRLAYGAGSALERTIHADSSRPGPALGWRSQLTEQGLHVPSVAFLCEALEIKLAPSSAHTETELLVLQKCRERGI